LTEVFSSAELGWIRQPLLSDGSGYTNTLLICAQNFPLALLRWMHLCRRFRIETERINRFNGAIAWTADLWPSLSLMIADPAAEFWSVTYTHT